MTRKQLESFFLEINEKPFRARQVMQWIHHRGVTDVRQMSDISLKLRDILLHTAEVIPPKVLEQKDSSDGTRKWLIEIPSGGVVESVLIPCGNRATLWDGEKLESSCQPSQISRL